MNKTRLFFCVWFGSGLASLLPAQDAILTEPAGNPESCTSIMAGKKATADGSVITSHTCDGNYRTWMNMVYALLNESELVAL